MSEKKWMSYCVWVLSRINNWQSPWLACDTASASAFVSASPANVEVEVAGRVLVDFVERVLDSDDKDDEVGCLRLHDTEMGRAPWRDEEEEEAEDNELNGADRGNDAKRSFKAWAWTSDCNSGWKFKKKIWEKKIRNNSYGESFWIIKLDPFRLCAISETHRRPVMGGTVMNDGVQPAWQLQSQKNHNSEEYPMQVNIEKFKEYGLIRRSTEKQRLNRQTALQTSDEKQTWIWKLNDATHKICHHPTSCTHNKMDKLHLWKEQSLTSNPKPTQTSFHATQALEWWWQGCQFLKRQSQRLTRSLAGNETVEPRKLEEDTPQSWSAWHIWTTWMIRPHKWQQSSTWSQFRAGWNKYPSDFPTWWQGAKVP